MPYLVDSNIFIAQREGQPGALALLERLAPEGLAISIITYMEVYQGTLRSPEPERAQAELAAFLIGIPIVPLSVAVARRCAELREDRAHQGNRVRSRALDLMTAATAIEYGFTLVTRNRRDFEDIVGLSLHDPL